MVTKQKTKKPAAGKAKRPAGKSAITGFSALERNILMAKGLAADALARLVAAGVQVRDHFRTVGDAATLAELASVPREVAERVMAWALGATPGADAGSGKVVVESGDVVNCVACGKRQPKDYKSGDLCVHCGKQAEPIFACYWCSGSGPGIFCRACGANFVSSGELELAILLKRDGLSKEDIPPRLSALTPAEKESLWGRVRSRR